MKNYSIYLIFLCLFVFSLVSIADESSSATAAVETSSTKTADEMESAPKKVKVKKTKKSTRDWDKISENDLEKDWEKGDDSFELEHEFERIQRIQAKKSQKMSSVLDSNDPAQIAKLYVLTSSSLNSLIEFNLEDLNKRVECSL